MRMGGIPGKFKKSCLRVNHTKIRFSGNKFRDILLECKHFKQHGEDEAVCSQNF